MSSLWTAKQFGGEFTRFGEKCARDARTKAAWKDLLKSYAIVRALGPLCGPQFAKKLVSAKGIWELIGKFDNIQPRVLFYFADKDREIRFMLGFIKQNKSDYRDAIALAQRRRSMIERQERALYDFDPNNIH